jgi:hypothetical protein
VDDVRLRVDSARAQFTAAEGVLQIKVQIQNPDGFLTPELSAKMEFLKTN